MSDHSTHRRNRRRGFTLIELLVVIAIVSLLAAMLLPVFATARENGRRAACASNLKQIALGIAQYTQDNDECYPIGLLGQEAAGGYPVQTDPGLPGAIYLSTNGSLNGHWITWMDGVFPYVKSTAIFMCPSATTKTISAYGFNSAESGFRRPAYSGAAGAATSGYAPMSLAEVKRPAENVLLADYNILFGSYANGFEYCLWTTFPAAQHPLWPHLDGGNIAYADGHVKWSSRTNPATTVGGWTNRAWNPFMD